MNCSRHHMKPTFLALFLMIAVAGFGQSYKTVSIIKERSYVLNGGARSYLDGKSRELIKIELPENTKGCYYGFSTAPGVDGTQILNLGLQLGAAIYGGFAGSSIASKIKVPTGSDVADVYVLTVDDANHFIQKEDYKWKPFRDISVQNGKEAVQYIDSHKYGRSFYIGLRNPSALDGINIKIEVVALVEDNKVDTDKGVLYGNMGKKAFEAKDYKKSLLYSTTALTYDPNLSFVKFNMALVYLVEGKKEAVDRYIDAIASCKKDKDPKSILTKALEDIRTIKTDQPTLKNLSAVEALLMEEIEKE